MDKKYILIIIIAAAICIAVAGIYLANSFTKEVEYTNLNLSKTCAVSVPVSNNSTFTDNDRLKTYNDTNLSILSYNKNDLGSWENLGAEIGITGGLNQNFKYNHSHHGKNILIHPDDNKTVYACLISNNTTGDVVIIVTPDEELLYHIIDTINFTVNNISQNASDDVVQATSNSDKTSDEDNSDKTTNGDEYSEGYIAENDQDFDYDGDGVGDGSAYHSHEYYVQRGQTEPTIPLSTD